MTVKRAALLVNIGSPDSTSVKDVKKYLAEFLSDPRVLDIPGPARWALLNLVILPTRPAKSAEAYKKVWTREGSPLMVFSKRQEKALQARLPGWKVKLGMRYGTPSISEALREFKRDGVTDIVLVPLYPQYSSAATGSSIAKVTEELSGASYVPSVRTVPAFYDDEGFLEVSAALIREASVGFDFDHVLFSYHGLPERQVKACDASGVHCLVKPDCCAEVKGPNHACYRAQSFATSRALAKRLQLTAFSTSFQSRLGRTPWIQPFTDVHLDELVKQGVKRLLVACPSFVTDCLETLEEVGLRAREQFKAAGGEDLKLVPCLNEDPRWIDALAKLVEAPASQQGAA